jgi:glycosyltransferase involved in cell wall biosynthesis
MLSVIIPIRNERRFVAACLDSVLKQLDTLPEYEVLCVDGASTDGTREILEEYALENPCIRIMDNPGKIVPTAMNRGIREAKGDIIIRLDCHAEYSENYIRGCREALERTGADNVGGYISIAAAEDTAVGRAVAAASAAPFGTGGAAYRSGGDEREVDSVPFGCFRRDVFTRFGMFDERLVRNQDIELNSRIRRGGGKVMITPNVWVKYYTRSTFRGIRQQAFNNGLWNPYTLYLTGGSLRVRHLIPLGFILSLLILGCGAFFFRPFRWLLSAEIMVYLAFGGVISRETARKARTSSLLVMLSFVQLHFAYGFGSLWGLVTAPFKFGFRPEQQTGEAIADRIY